jgi:hypothetical protein
MFLIEEHAVLQAVVELAEHAVEQVALCSGVPVSGLASAAVVGVGAWGGGEWLCR